MIGGIDLNTKYNILEWQDQLYEKYIVFRKKSNNCKASTERTIRSALYNFFDYINNREIKEISAVEAIDLKTGV